MDANFDEAQRLFSEGNYDGAFAAFKELAEDSEHDLLLRSDAYNMMGVIVSGPAPYLSNSDDESGLPYFKISLQLHPQNLDAALNILENYDAGYTGHHDRETVRAICLSLASNFQDHLSEREKEIMIKALRKYDRPSPQAKLSS